jgi:hypothetical protein
METEKNLPTRQHCALVQWHLIKFESWTYTSRHESNFQLSVWEPNAPNTCEASLNQTKKGLQTLHLNGYDLIAVDAVDRGLLNRPSSIGDKWLSEPSAHHKSLSPVHFHSSGSGITRSTSRRINAPGTRIVPDFTRAMRNSIERTSGTPQPRTSSALSTQQQCWSILTVGFCARKGIGHA